ncbi:glycoside hydrolase family 18 protein [Gonapodya prolifera JEL478]|uniref:Glycoside hydrolase family 18 protein n=1 Tax=Gonapodya prolifera (strain JEL478) TaxID=1344416 RepID=A0A139AIQ9_GONPJ|nr:glycoside hydrolase family 18 protein [Gonapodya prolifera JEL478]|eukprot:KXS16686.1 glycoside hydrolase family 18 protein [Gonapodya prolifera JEL478]
MARNSSPPFRTWTVHVLCVALLAELSLGLLPTDITNPRSPYQLIGFWGQNRVASLDTSKVEGTLASTCQLTPYATIHVGYLLDHFATKGAPSMDFSSHCSFGGAFAYPGYETKTNGYTLLHCSDIAKDIKACQRVGRRVVLTLSPKTVTLLSESDGNRSAYQIYSMFFDRTVPGDPRPFDDAVFDGLDMQLNITESQDGYRAFVNTLRALFNRQDPPPLSGTAANVSGIPAVFNGTAWIATPSGTNGTNGTAAGNATVGRGGQVVTGNITGWTPQTTPWTNVSNPVDYYRLPTTFTLSATLTGCDLPDPILGPSNNTLLSVVPTKFDYLLVSYRHGANCTWANQDGFWANLQSWSNWVAGVDKLEFAAQLPNMGWGYEAFTESDPNTFINTTFFYSASLIPRLRTVSKFTAVSLYDSSFDQLNLPCTAPSTLVTSRYVDLLYTDLTSFNTTADGTNTPVGKQCVWKDSIVVQGRGNGTGRPAGPVSPVATPAATSGGGLTTGAIAGIAVGGLAGVAVIGGAAFVTYRSVYVSALAFSLPPAWQHRC